MGNFKIIIIESFYFCLMMVLNRSNGLELKSEGSRCAVEANKIIKTFKERGETWSQEIEATYWFSPSAAIDFGNDGRMIAWSDLRKFNAGSRQYTHVIGEKDSQIFVLEDWSYINQVNIPRAWQNIFILVPSNNPQEEVSRLEFIAKNITINSSIYFVFFRSGLRPRNETCIVNIYEAYVMKTNSFIRLVHSIEVPGRPDELNSGENTADLKSIIARNLFRRRMDFEGVKIKAIIKKKSLFRIWQKNGLFGHKRFSEELMLLENLQDFQKIINFSESLALITKKKLNSAELPTSNEIDEDEDDFDVSIFHTTLLPSRAKRFRFIQPTYESRMSAVFQDPPQNSFKNIVTAPFTIGMWVTTLGTWLFLVLTTKLIGKALLHARITCREDEIFCREFPTWLVTTTCQKSWHIVPKKRTLRIVFILVSLSSIVLYIGYSAAIVSTLSVDLHPIKGLEDLIRNKYTLTTHEKSKSALLFVQYIKKTSLKTVKSRTVTTSEEIDHLLQGKNALITHPILFFSTALRHNYSHRFMCKAMNLIPASNEIYKSALIVPRNSELRQFFNFAIIRKKEGGLIHRGIRYYNKRFGILCLFGKNGETSHEVHRREPIKFLDVLTTFGIIFTGALVSTAIFLLEISQGYLQERKKVQDCCQ